MLGQIRFPVEKALGHVYKDVFIGSITSAHESMFPSSPLQGAFPSTVGTMRSMWSSHRLSIFSQGSPCACYRQFDLRNLLLPHFDMLPSPNLKKADIPSLRNSWWAHRGGEPVVPSFWLPDNVQSVMSLGTLAFLKAPDAPWNDKHYRTSH